MDALGVLKQEHALILKRLLSVEDTARELSAVLPSERQKSTEKLLEDCKLAWQEIFQHIRNEEEALFPMLDAQLAHQEGLVHAMRNEHGDIIGTMMSLFGEIVKGVGRREVLDDNFVEKVQNFRSQLSEHISREDKILFWLAELHLSPSDRRRVSLELAEISRPNANFRVS